MKRPNYVFDDELYHWGIKGQRWGERRFQNEDGSWTPEGRERYGKGDGDRIKIEKAKATYNTQKYKADLKSKAQKEKDVRAAKEERNRIRQQAKTEKFARREQAKLDRKQAKLDARLEYKDTASLKNKLVRTKRYAMSDEELSKAIDRLKLEVEYNKQYALASKPNSALARADRFFEGATGKATLELAKAVLPNVATAATKSIVDYSLKKNDPKEAEKKDLEIEKAKVELENLRKQSSNQQNVNKQQAQAQQNVNKQQAQAQNDVSKEQNKVNENTNTQNVKQKKEKVKSVMNDAKIVTSNIKSTVDTGYRLYKLYSDRVSSRPVSSINNSKPVTSSIPKSALQLPASNIAGLLPARSEVLSKKR